MVMTCCTCYKHDEAAEVRLILVFVGRFLKSHFRHETAKKYQ